MKKVVTLKKLYHRDRWRIAMYFTYDERLKDIVKSIPGVAYSVTNKCFYVDYSEENMRFVLKILKDCVETDISGLVVNESTGKPDEGRLLSDGSDKKHLVSDVKQKPELKPEPDNAGIAHSAGRMRIPEPQTDQGVHSVQPSASSRGESRDVTVTRQVLESWYSPVEFRINEREGRLVVKFTGRYDKAWIGELCSYGRYRYDKTNREWLLPWSKITVDSLADYFSSKGVRVNVVKQQVNPVLQEDRKVSAEIVKSKKLVQEAQEGLDLVRRYLDENRYSIRTRESYMALLEFFFRYFSPRKPGEIKKEEISEFITEHVIKLGYSPSYQNQMVSAIKMYYQVAGRGSVNPELLERPRRMRALPKVLSKEEVSSVLNSARNLKHKLLLWMIYSCGLRRSEVINIRLRDLDRERNILYIRQGKGGVDRIVPLSPIVWVRIDEYKESFRPVEYLFEGQSGGRYSAESVYRVFKDAMRRAGILKDVGVHSLRHSYATHLHEKGLDIRYIQELLGHKSTRTTEIYTHVSRRNLMQVRSPIEDLDLK